ncbi:MAG: hypothetical protein AB7N76_02270 [Planctomycetota bacterium]
MHHSTTRRAARPAAWDRRRDPRTSAPRSLRNLLLRRARHDGWSLLAFGRADGTLLGTSWRPEMAARLLREAARLSAEEVEALDLAERPLEQQWGMPAGFLLHAARVRLGDEELLLIALEEPYLEKDELGVCLLPRPPLVDTAWRAAVIHVEHRLRERRLAAVG